MRELRICMEINGLAEDENGNSCPGGMSLSLGMVPDDYEPLVEAGKMLMNHGFSPKSHLLGCYCLCGYKGDTFEKAEERFEKAIRAGFLPYAMLYRDEKGETNQDWRKFQREWIRPQIVSARFSAYWNKGE